MNNPSIQNNSTDIEKLWTLLIKKYMITFNEENVWRNHILFNREGQNKIIKDLVGDLYFEICKTLGL